MSTVNRGCCLTPEANKATVEFVVFTEAEFGMSKLGICNALIEIIHKRTFLSC